MTRAATAAIGQSPLLRWSSVRDCPRKAVLEATGAPARDRTDAEERWLYRGKSIGRDYIVWLAAKYGKVYVASGDNWWVPPHLRADTADKAAILAELPIEWELGVGHMDGYLKETSTALEFLSSAHASDAMIRSKLLQLTGYARHYPPATNACLIVLDPSSLQEDRYPVAFDTEAFRHLLEECEERIEQVMAWNATGGLPPRVCGKPGDAWGHFCRVAETCFEGWEAPEPVALTQDPEAVHVATLLHAAKQEERAAKATLAEAETYRKKLENELADQPAMGLALGALKEGVRVGPFHVKRTYVQRSPSLDVKKARLAGAINDEALAEYMKPGAAYWTTTIERVELDARPPAEGFGDEAPWTDDDLGEAA